MSDSQPSVGLKLPRFGSNRFCGPSVISMLTGDDTDTIAQDAHRTDHV